MTPRPVQTSLMEGCERPTGPIPESVARVARVADARTEGLDEEGGRWYVVCQPHGELVQVESRGVARADARAANDAGDCGEWCEECREEASCRA